MMVNPQLSNTFKLKAFVTICYKKAVSIQLATIPCLFYVASLQFIANVLAPHTVLQHCSLRHVLPLLSIGLHM